MHAKPLILAAAAVLLAAASPAERAPGNPQIDFAGFLALSEDVAAQREARLLDYAAFQRKASEPDALILDARSADAYRAGHIEGAISLPLTDFTAASLAAAIGDPDRPILIYCNNNFSNDAPPVPIKAIRLALNIQTFVNLVGYGYPNVYELDEVVDFRDPKVRWQTAIG